MAELLREEEDRIVDEAGAEAPKKLGKRASNSTCNLTRQYREICDLRKQVEELASKPERPAKRRTASTGS
jgi:hypothetical protein